MYILEKYTGEKTYMLPNGKLGTKEFVLEQYPAALSFTFVVTTDENGEVMMGMDNLSLLRSIHGIDKTLSEDDAIVAIEKIINTPAIEDNTPTAEERIAAALEYQIISSLPDETESEGVE